MSRLHRFYIDPDATELTQSFWLNDNKPLLHQWLNVLRLGKGSEVVLFDGVQHERLYTIHDLDQNGVHLRLVTEFERKVPPRQVYVLWSLLKKDKNDWVLQKGTELGVSNFVPLLAARSEKTGFDDMRARKIVVEAAEQCGRSDIPHIRELLSPETALEQLKDKVRLFICDERADEPLKQADDEACGVFIGPEGGWTDDEMAMFTGAGLKQLHLGSLTLRAETAALAAATKLLA